MAIHDRDYMKRRTDEENERSSSLESRTEAIAERILAKAGTVIMVVCVALGIVAVIVWIVSHSTGAGH
jgi:CHASE3 domain sensor protein